MRVLIIEDDKDTRESLKMVLERESFAVDSAADGQRGSYMARTNDYDIVLLDNNLPIKTGLEVCTDIRNASNNVPILLLSVKSEADEKALLLDSGADDYLSKPYSHKELLARMRAVTRRAPAIQPDVFVIGDLVVNCGNCEVKMGGKEVYLTRKEFSLLELLLRHRGKTVSRGIILEHVWDMDINPMSKTVETHILNLRKKLERKGERLIHNVHGRGYKILA
ncbi:MAG TPA: response regulator transcription factor [Candidatus Paceibacterota bacterium]